MFKKKFVKTTCLLVTLCSLNLCSQVYASQATIEPCFCPYEDCTSKLLGYIEQTKRNIYVQAYSFTSTEIAEALIKLYKKGIPVIVYIDKGRDKETFSQTNKLRSFEIPVIVQDSYKKGLAHNKVIIIDERIVITGSFNWTKNASKNEENINFIRSKTLAKMYIDNWHKNADIG